MSSSASNESVSINYELLIKKIDESWSKLLTSEFDAEYFRKLIKFLSSEYYTKKVFPPINLIHSWSFFSSPQNIKVVILGQDPYHNDGQAMGLAFSVPPNVSIPPSLINIYKELRSDISHFTTPTHGCLIGWAKQGVLLLNTSLTVRAHEAASHSNKGWELFTDKVIRSLSHSYQSLVFMLWGGHAQKKGRGVIDRKRHLVLEAVHPSPLSAHRGFFGCKHFSKANAYLIENNRKPIDWNDLPTK